MTPFIILYLAIGFVLAANALKLMDDAPTWARIAAFIFDLLLWPFHLFISVIILLVVRR
jgi:hypothetical protein